MPPKKGMPPRKPPCRNCASVLQPPAVTRVRSQGIGFRPPLHFTARCWVRIAACGPHPVPQRITWGLRRWSLRAGAVGGTPRGARSEACRRYLGRQRPLNALVHPHPRPLGRGRISGSVSANPASQECSGDGVRGPLSPKGEGRRGEGEGRNRPAIPCDDELCPPPDNLPNLSGIALGRAHSAKRVPGGTPGNS